MFGRKKRINFYSVRTINNPNVMLTITLTRAESEEFVNKLLFTEKYDDFSSWCFYQKLEVDSNSWLKYFNTRLDMESKTKYIIQEMSYTKKELAAILRMFCGCKAIGCSFDLKEEQVYVDSKRAIQEALENQFKEYLDKLDDGDNLEDWLKDKIDSEDMIQ